MSDLNKVLMIGRLTRDPELRYTSAGIAVSDFSIALNRNHTNSKGDRVRETCFVDVTLWHKKAEVAAEYLKKGSAIFIEGRLALNTWTANDGSQRQKLKVVADSFQFLDQTPRDSVMPDMNEQTLEAEE